MIPWGRVMENTIQVFEVAKWTRSGWMLLLFAVSVLILFVIAVLTWPRSLQVELGPEQLEIRGSVYGRRVPLSELELDGARVVDLTQASPLQLGFRSNGINLPGYSVGWFNLKNGERALTFVTDRKNVVYLPTRNRYALLLSVANPEAFLAALSAR
jgi:hypothetical protein